MGIHYNCITFKAPLHCQSTEQWYVMENFKYSGYMISIRLLASDQDLSPNHGKTWMKITIAAVLCSWKRCGEPGHLMHARNCTLPRSSLSPSTDRADWVATKQFSQPNCSAEWTYGGLSYTVALKQLHFASAAWLTQTQYPSILDIYMAHVTVVIEYLIIFNVFILTTL